MQLGATMKTVNSKILTYQTFQGYKCVTRDDIEKYLNGTIPDPKYARNKFSRVKMFMDLANREGWDVRLRRYFDTWELKRWPNAFCPFT